MKVFISSVIQGYELFRKAAKQAVKDVGQEPVLSEDFGARSHTPRHACLKDISECPIFIGIYGKRYGSETSSGISICEEEFNEAKRLNKEILIFVEDINGFESKQREFLDSLQDFETGFCRRKFNTLVALRKGILEDLGRCLEEMAMPTSEDIQHANIKKHDYYQSRIPELIKSCDMPGRSFFFNENHQLNSLIILGKNAPASDVISASLIEQEIRKKATLIETNETTEERKYNFKDIRIGETINITFENLESLWYYDYKQSNIFDINNPHEEIVVRFDKIGINENDMPSNEDEHIGFYGICRKKFHEIPEKPSLLYKISNIPIPNMLNIGKYQIPTLEYFRNKKRFPFFKLFDRIYHVNTVGRINESDFQKCEGNDEWFEEKLGIVITGIPKFYENQFIYSNEPLNYDGYEVSVKDIDIHHQKVWMHIINPKGDEYDCWLKVNESPEFSEDKVFMDIAHVSYFNEIGERKILYEYPNFLLDCREIFCGKNILCVRSNIYVLSDEIDFCTSNTAYIEEPDSYLLKIKCQENTFDIVFAPCETINLERLENNIFIGPNNFFKIHLTNIYNDYLDLEIIKKLSLRRYKKIIPLELPEKMIYLYGKIDSEELDKFNLVLIGTSTSNPFIFELSKLRISPDDGFPPDWMLTSNGEYKIYTNPFGNGRDILVISGSNPENARLAAEDFVTKL